MGHSEYPQPFPTAVSALACEAVTRPTMRFVPIKSVEQQAALALHRTRDLLVRQRTQLVNMIRGLLAEFGIAIPKGITNALAFVRRAAAGEANEVPDLATKVIAALAEQAIEVQDRIRQLERDLLASYRSNDLARRIATVPGVGLLGATAIAATVTDPTQFRSGRQFAAWLGLTPLNNSTGGKERLGRISKMGDQYLRRLLVTGMTSLVRRNKHHPGLADPRINALLAPTKVRFLEVRRALGTAGMGAKWKDRSLGPRADCLVWMASRVRKRICEGLGDGEPVGPGTRTTRRNV